MIFKRIQYFSLIALLSCNLAYSLARSASQQGLDHTASLVDADIPAFMEHLVKKQKEKRTKSNPSKKGVKLPSPPCDAPTPIAQADLPFTTPAPGKYCVVEDLTFSGGAAITVTEDNVCIDFDCHSLTLDPIATQGIVAANVFDLSVKNGVIKASAVSSDVGSIGISLVTVDGVTIDNMALRDTRRGILADTGAPAGGSTNITVTNGEFAHPAVGLGRGLQTSFINGLVVKDCLFGELGRQGILGLNSDRNIQISGCRFVSGFSSAPVGVQDAILYVDVSGLTSNIAISNCQFFDPNPVRTNSRFGIRVLNAVAPDKIIGNVSITDCNFDSYDSVIVIRGALDVGGGPISDVLIQNCTVLHSTFASVILADCLGVLVENSLFHCLPSAIGNFRAVATTTLVLQRDLIVRNCSFTFLDPVPIEHSVNALVIGHSSCLFENCIFDSNATQFGESEQRPGNLIFTSFSPQLQVFTGPIVDAKVLNCQFSNNPTNHIISEAGNTNIVIEGCTINGGVEQSILFEGTSNSVIKNNSIITSNGSGIVLTNGVHNEQEFFSQNNLIFQNNIQNNARDGIVLKNNSSKNTIEQNVASNNGNDGIFIDHTSCKNTVIDNKVFNNFHDGINNKNCKCNEFYDNSACNNKNENYVNVRPIVSVGELARVGGNLDCCKKKKSKWSKS